MELIIGQTNDGYLSIRAHRLTDGVMATVYVNDITHLVRYIDLLKNYEKITLRFERLSVGRKEHIISEIRNNITL